MHRFALQAALTLALVSVPTAAYAATMTLPETFTVSGNTGSVMNDGLYGIASTSFSQFNPSLGTLNSITFSLQGTATSQAFDVFFAVTPTNASTSGIGVTNQGNGINGQLFKIEASATNSSEDLSDFEGTGMVGLLLQFLAPTSNVSVPSSTLTYNYTPAAPVSVTPEPSSLVLLGTGVLGVAGVLKRRLA